MKNLIGSDQGSICPFSAALLKSTISCSAVERTPIVPVDVQSRINGYNGITLPSRHENQDRLVGGVLLKKREQSIVQRLSE